MRLAIDTNRYVDLCRGDSRVVEILSRAQSLHMPFVVLAELRAGFRLGTQTRINERALQRFLAMPTVHIVFPTEATTVHYSDLFRQLREQGTPIPTNDLWIAALVAEHRLTLYSRDEHFRHLAQLDVLT
ncbi:MAG: type II toxin-antitoxin system VapC family toxin [Planctomycetes bacterium]|nr:type II toxin-antitoxin system VapC family toxin [Planctomycetota bacterium]